MEFVEGGELMGYSLRHPNGGPGLALRLDPGRAEAAAGFDYFAIGVPDKGAIEALARRLSALGETHAGVHFATIGWILPMVHDPDGHEVRFYTVEHYSELDPDGVSTVHDPRGTAERRSPEHQQGEQLVTTPRWPGAPPVYGPLWFLVPGGSVAWYWI